MDYTLNTVICSNTLNFDFIKFLKKRFLAKIIKRHKLSTVATGEMMKEYKDSKIWCEKHEYNRIKSWKNTLRILF